MSLVRWEPFSGVDEIFNRMLPASFGRLPRFTLPSNGEKVEWAPSADISETEKYHRIESFRGTFARSFSLPENANAEAIRCESKDGVLVVHIPKVKVEAPKAKQIKVE